MGRRSVIRTHLRSGGSRQGKEAPDFADGDVETARSLEAVHPRADAPLDRCSLRAPAMSGRSDRSRSGRA